jgi:outer membrane protein TolC
MHPRRIVCWLLAVQLAVPFALNGQTPDPDPMAGAEPARTSTAGFRPAQTLLEALDPPALRTLAAEVLERNPDTARQRRQAAAMAVRAPQVRALPDPVAALTVFVLPPETRVGAQRLSASISQKLPWFGKLALKEQAALYAAAKAAADVETIRLDVLTETRRLAYELSFLDSHQAILEEERNALVRFEQAAQARYAAGLGLQQEIVRIQAQITRVDTRLLDISERRASLLAAVNALRDRPADEPVGAVALPEPQPLVVDRAGLGHEARARRPELAAADAEIAARAALIELALKSFRPDVTLGFSYTAVERRDDAAGRANPPPDDGDDVLALTGSVNLPVWRRKLEAGVEEAQALRRAAEEDKRRILAGIERSIGELAARMPLLFDHWRLLETVLRVQAREALRSAETAYSTGKLNAVDLLDAEVVLLEVRIAAARTRADLAVARAELERAVARSLKPRKESRAHDR